MRRIEPQTKVYPKTRRQDTESADETDLHGLLPLFMFLASESASQLLGVE